MLSFETLSIQIGSDHYTLYPDSLNPLHWYYLPLVPRVTQINSKLQFQLIKYRAGASEEGPRGGLFIFTVDLSLSNETKQQIQTNLKTQKQLSDLPTLSPPLWMGGKVKLMILNRTQSVQPALLGNSQATFTVELTPEEVSLLEKTLKNGKPPLGIAYSLDYEAIRPAYKFQIEAEWDRVQTYLEQRFQAGFVLFSVDIENVIETLEENKYIRVTLENYETDQSKEAARNVALQEIQQMLLSQFFEPAIEPINPGVEAPLRFGFRYVTVNVQQVQKRSLNLTMTTRLAVQRRTFPQGIGLGWPVTPQALAPYVQEISLDDTYFKNRKIEVLCYENFETDRIAQINVTLKYGDQLQTLLFTAIGSQTASWPSIKKWDGSMQRDVTINYQVIFKIVDGNQWSAIESLPEVTTNDRWVLNPCQLYRIQTVHIGSLNSFPWSAYRSVIVQVEYRDDSRNLVLQGIFSLTKDKPEEDWKFLIRSSQQYQLQYQITYVSLDRKEWVTSWKTAQGFLIAYDEFLPREKTLQVHISSLTWSSPNPDSELEASDSKSEATPETPVAIKAYVSLEGTSELLTFTADKQLPQSLTIKTTEEYPIFKYFVYVQFQRTPDLKLGPSYTKKSVLLLSPNMKARQVVVLSTGSLDFQKNKIKELEVALRTAADLEMEKRYKFFSKNESDYFEFEYEDEFTYQWQIITTIRDDVLSPRRIYSPGPTEKDWGMQMSQQFNLAGYIRL
ncbi:MAG: hypothetical protein MUE44_09025 [Oscillatoriaceae cyanobacterium Prado104]|jgi:hypothetical protein|nr:hypothetical protein [Oscillatoriaceae cyanobacterium Prado104]